MGLTMSDDGGLELFVEFFVAAASLALTSSSFAVVSSSLRVVWSSCLTTASNFCSNSLKRCSHRSQSGHPFPVLMDDDSTRNRRILEHRFQAVNSYNLIERFWQKLKYQWMPTTAWDEFADMLDAAIECIEQRGRAYLMPSLQH